MELVRRHIPEVSDGERDAALLRAMRYANRLGITGVHDMSEPQDLSCFARIRDSGRATLRIRSFIMCEDWSAYFQSARRFAGDDWVTVGGFKGFMDWGFWPLLAEALADAGMAACRFNLSGSGVGEDGETFSEKERFESNTHSPVTNDNRRSRRAGVWRSTNRTKRIIARIDSSPGIGNSEIASQKNSSQRHRNHAKSSSPANN